MIEEKILSPQTIEDTPFPQEVAITDYGVTQSSNGGVSETSKIKNQSPPYKRVATELLGSALNTKSRKILAEFEFTESGALQIGKYEPGVSGDVRLTPNGITARDLSGITTFALDGDTGNAVFKGTIQAGSFVGGEVIVGNNRLIMDGSTGRFVVYDEQGIPRIVIGYLEGGF